MVPENSHSDPQHGTFVPLHEDRIGCPIPTEHRLDNFSVGLHVNV